MVETERGDEHRAGGGNGFDGAKRAFRDARADDDRGEPDQLVDMRGGDGLGAAARLR